MLETPLYSKIVLSDIHSKPTCPEQAWSLQALRAHTSADAGAGVRVCVCGSMRGHRVNFLRISLGFPFEFLRISAGLLENVVRISFGFL